MLLTYAVLLLIPVLVKTVSALDCLSCTDLEFEPIKVFGTDITSYMNAILGGFQENNCKKDNADVSMSGVDKSSCAAATETGQEARCSYIKGKIKASVDLGIPVIPSFDLPLEIYRRGCQNVNENEQTGCIRHRGDKFNLALQSLLYALKQLSVLEFDGVQCTCRGNMCDTSDASRIPNYMLHYYIIAILFLLKFL